jgi:hypothetical protein
MKTNSLSNTGSLEMSPVAPRRRSGGGTLYLLLWLLMATGAFIYLATLALAPSNLMAFLGSSKAPTTESNSVAAAEGPSAADLEGDIARLRVQLEQVQGEVRTLVATNQNLTDRLETIENASIQLQPGDEAAVAVAQRKNGGAAAPEDSGITGVVIDDDGASADGTGATEPDAAATPTPTKKKSNERLDEKDQASGEQLAETSPEPTPKAEKKKFGLELAISTSPEALQLNWDLLSERHGALLKGLSARAQPSPGDPSSYRLVAGPFTSAQQAQSLCAKLKKQNVACQVTGFGGDSL